MLSYLIVASIGMVIIIIVTIYDDIKQYKLEKMLQQREKEMESKKEQLNRIGNEFGQTLKKLRR